MALPDKYAIPARPPKKVSSTAPPAIVAGLAIAPRPAAKGGKLRPNNPSPAAAIDVPIPASTPAIPAAIPPNRFVKKLPSFLTSALPSLLSVFVSP